MCYLVNYLTSCSNHQPFTTPRFSCLSMELSAKFTFTFELSLLSLSLSNFLTRVDKLLVRSVIMIFLNRICAPRCLCGILETYVNISAHRRFSQRTEWRPYNSNLKRLSALTYVIENIPNKINLCPFINMTTCRSISNIAPSADTIFALSSGHGKCGVAVIRVSGPAAVTALKDMGRFTKLPPNKTAILRKLVHPSSREAIDKGLVLWFPGTIVRYNTVLSVCAIIFFQVVLSPIEAIHCRIRSWINPREQELHWPLSYISTPSCD